MRIAGILIALVGLAGCGWYFEKADRQYQISVESAPSGLDFVIHAPLARVIGRGTTPAEVTLSLRDTRTLRPSRYRIMPEGALRLDRPIESEGTGWYINGHFLGSGFTKWFFFDPVQNRIYSDFTGSAPIR